MLFSTVLGFLSGTDFIVILLVFLVFYIVYRVISASMVRNRNDAQAQDYIQGRNQQTQLLSEILAELKKLNEKA